MGKERVLIINTGGTIGMVNSEQGNLLSPLTPAKTWAQIAGNHPILDPKLLGVDTGYHQFDPLLDSSSIQYENWKEMAEVIADHYAAYTGFVILHGTDTLCYTATALSFMLEHLAKPVILTGSQIPMVRPRSDAVQNLVTSIQIAASTSPLVPEVCIFFHDHLLRGNRSRKLSSSGYAGFQSPNYPTLASAGEHIAFNTKVIRPKPDEGKFFANTYLNTRVMVLEIFPGFDPAVFGQIFRDEVPEDDRIKGLILKTFGAGNVPESAAFLDAIAAITKQGTIVVDVTQCPEGMVELGLYEASSGLLNRGVTSGVDLTPEAAVCKLMYLLGQNHPPIEVQRLMQVDINGEQSLNIINIPFSESAAAAPVLETAESIPGGLDLSRLRTASIRVHKAAKEGAKENDVLKLRLFLNHPRVSPDIPDSDPRLAATIERTLRTSGTLDLFADVTAASQRLIKPGQRASLALVTDPGSTVSWERVTLSFYTAVN